MCIIAQYINSTFYYLSVEVILIKVAGHLFLLNTLFFSNNVTSKDEQLQSSHTVKSDFYYIFN